MTNTLLFQGLLVGEFLFLRNVLNISALYLLVQNLYFGLGSLVLLGSDHLPQVEVNPNFVVVFGTHESLDVHEPVSHVFLAGLEQPFHL